MYSWNKLAYAWNTLVYSWTKLVYSWTKLVYSWNKLAAGGWMPWDGWLAGWALHPSPAADVTRRPVLKPRLFKKDLPRKTSWARHDCADEACDSLCVTFAWKSSLLAGPFPPKRRKIVFLIKPTTATATKNREAHMHPPTTWWTSARAEAFPPKRRKIVFLIKTTTATTTKKSWSTHAPANEMMDLCSSHTDTKS